MILGRKNYHNRRGQKYHHKYALICGHTSDVVPLPILLPAQDYIGESIECLKCHSEKRVVMIMLFDPLYPIKEDREFI
jgi:hypothetical protein